MVGPDGFTMPATERDAALWLAGGSHDVVFDAAIGLLTALGGVARLAEETVGWT